MNSTELWLSFLFDHLKALCVFAVYLLWLFNFPEANMKRKILGVISEIEE